MKESRPLAGCDVLPPMTQPKNQQPSMKGSAKRTRRKASAGRFQMLNTFVDETMRGHCRGDIVVWLVLYRDTRDGTARTGQTDIARRTGISVRGVAKALKRLEKQKLLKVVYRGGLNRGPSRYRVSPLPATDD